MSSEASRTALQKYNLANRTKEERSAIARKSVAKQRQNREEKMQLQKCMRTLLALPTKGDKAKQVLKDFGFSSDQANNKTLLMVALFQKGVRGDVTAIREIISMMDKLDLFQDTGKIQGDVIINLLPVGQPYVPNKADEKEIWDAEHSADWMEEPKQDEWNPDEEPSDDWGNDVYDGS